MGTHKHSGVPAASFGKVRPRHSIQVELPGLMKEKLGLATPMALAAALLSTCTSWELARPATVAPSAAVLRAELAAPPPREIKLKTPPQFLTKKGVRSAPSGNVPPAPVAMTAQERCEARCDGNYEVDEAACQSVPPARYTACHTEARGRQGACIQQKCGGAGESN